MAFCRRLSFLRYVQLVNATFGEKILIIYSEERGEKESHALLPMEKMAIFVSGQKVVKYESSNRVTKGRNCRDAASGLHKKSYLRSDRERQVRTLA